MGVSVTCDWCGIVQSGTAISNRWWDCDRLGSMSADHKIYCSSACAAAGFSCDQALWAEWVRRRDVYEAQAGKRKVSVTDMAERLRAELIPSFRDQWEKEHPEAPARVGESA